MSGLKKWRTSVILLLVYAAVFHAWMAVGASERIVGTVIVASALSVFLVNAARERYFLNRWDFVFHLCVVLDILLEGLFVSIHNDLGFYLCALGFAVIIGSYRAFILRKRMNS